MSNMSDLLIHSHTHTDARGELHVVEPSDLPFVPVRTFWISHVPAGETRGGHAHRTCAEVIFPLQGSVQITVDNAQEPPVTYTLNHPEQGLHIPPNVWCHLHHFSPDALLLVLASEAYDPQGYIHDYDHFRHG